MFSLTVQVSMAIGGDAHAVYREALWRVLPPLLG